MVKPVAFFMCIACLLFVACGKATIEGGPSPSIPAQSLLTSPPAPAPSPVAAPLVIAPLTLPPPRPALRGVSPIQPGNRPSGIAGRNNGELSPADLIKVDENCSAARAAAPGIAKLFAAARAVSVRLGARECYRPFVAQVSARGGACSGGNCACAGPPGHSMHGWGEAADFRDLTTETTTFVSPVYNWLKQKAAQFGWNHPGWAEPGGSPCPEPWHWEWVGDGGTAHADSIPADSSVIIPTATGHGYWTVKGLGDVSRHGDAGFCGLPEQLHLEHLIVAAAGFPGGKGCWLAASDGAVIGYGDAKSMGAPPSLKGDNPIVGMAATPSGAGYWLAASEGQVFGFGDAGALQSKGTSKAARPIVGIASSGAGGYWLAASNGEVMAFGDAPAFSGSSPLKAGDVITGIAAAPGAKGGWLSGFSGEIYPFGDAPRLTTPARITEPVVSIAATPSGKGLLLGGLNGKVWPVGDAAG